MILFESRKSRVMPKMVMFNMGVLGLLDQQGNVEADTAADLGRRHQTEVLINARRRLLQARSYWLSCHRRSSSLHDCYCQGLG